MASILATEADGKTPKVKPRLFIQQAKVDRAERWHTGGDYGDMSPSRLTSILKSVGNEGALEQWAMLCEHALDTCEHLESLVDTRIQRVVGAPWKAVPPKDIPAGSSAYAEGAAKLCGSMLDAMPDWEEHFTDVLNALGVGASAHQLTMGRNLKLGAYVYEKMENVHIRRFHYGEQWDLRLYDYGQKGSGEYGEVLLPDIWLVHIAGSRGKYPGKAGFLRPAMWPWLFWTWARKFWMHGVEIGGQPFIHAKVPNEATDAVVNEVVDKLQGLSYDTVAAFREGTDIIMDKQASIGDGAAFQNFMTHAEGGMTKLILGASDITDPGVHGSQSAVETREEATLDPRTVSDAKRVGGDIAAQMFEPVCRINKALFGGTTPPIPEYVAGGDAKEDRMPEVRGEPEAEEIEDALVKPETEEAVEEPEGAAEEVAAETGGDVGIKDVSMSGVQIKSMLEVVNQVAAGLIPRETGVEVLVTAFPIDRAQAEKIMGEVGQGFVQETEPEEPVEVEEPAALPNVATPPKAGRSGQSQTTLTSKRSQSPIAKALRGE